MKSILVLISGNGSNLQAIIDGIDSQQIDGQICAVISNNDKAYGLERAEKSGIAHHSLDHKSFASRELYDKALMDLINAFKPDLIVLAGFMRILSEDFVKYFSVKMLNIHPSLLPKYKGLNTHQRAMDAGDKEHGASIHFVTPDLDGGPVIIQSKVPIFEQDNLDDLTARVQQQELNIYPLVVNWFCQGRLKMENGYAFMDGEQLPTTGYAAD